VITEGHGIPLAVSLTGGNRNDVTQLMPLVQAIPPVRGRRGRPRQRPDAVYADRGYDHDKYRRQVRDKGITPVIARRGTDHGSGLGTYRWVIEQSVALCSGGLITVDDVLPEVPRKTGRTPGKTLADIVDVLGQAGGANSRKRLRAIQQSGEEIDSAIFRIAQD